MGTATLRLAMKLSQSYERQYNEYLEACDHDRRNGYRPHYCEHGTDMWTDYDNICGPCEDGISMGDPMFRRRHALDSAKDRVREANELADFMAESQKRARQLHVPNAINESAIWARIRVLFDVD